MGIITYHATMSSKFKEILKIGRIEVSSKVPSTYINDKYYSIRTYHLAEGCEGTPMTIKQLLSDEENSFAKIDNELREVMDKAHDEVDEQVNNITFETRRLKVRELWKRYSNTKLPIYISEGNPTKDLVYLADKDKVIHYARGFLVEFRGLEFDKYLPNPYKEFGVILTLDVIESKLKPDLNDGRTYKRSTEPEWFQTYSTIGQCVHEGAIPVNCIKEVRFIVPESMSIEAYKGLGIPFDRSLTLQEAKKVISTWKFTLNKMEKAVEFRGSHLS